MRIEAELKAVVRDPARVREALRRRAPEVVNVYHDAYYDTPGGDHERDGREIRVRMVDDGAVNLLTFKDSAVDAASGSKPEYETTVGDPVAMGAVLGALGLQETLRYEKRCANFRFEHEGFDLLATLVTLPELEGTWLEVETLVEPGAVPDALAAIRDAMTQVGIGPGDLTTELYTDAARARRATTLGEHGRT
ncbi:class IV adenylate cyclase [Nonomuraea sp. SYSU D8015]|uniref:class IV adenylate cyclase n=1 Tax=Nonomuraea sp. SYSU D8015 TaxID=2593644 RepID=UPI001660CF88|nr:class IV adenylate cyclase [Nonomuraea sp. SYSU D8015]